MEKKRGKSWVVKNLRPEDVYKEPSEFYNAQEAKRFAGSSSMRLQQEKLTRRAVELSGVETGRVLDAGCGAGFSTAWLKQAGFDVVGIDVAPEMVKHAREKGLRVTLADVRKLRFEKHVFDLVISISAFQWLLNKPGRERVRET